MDVNRKSTLFWKSEAITVRRLKEDLLHLIKLHSIFYLSSLPKKQTQTPSAPSLTCHAVVLSTGLKYQRRPSSQVKGEVEAPTRLVMVRPMLDAAGLGHILADFRNFPRRCSLRQKRLVYLPPFLPLPPFFAAAAHPLLLMSLLQALRASSSSFFCCCQAACCARRCSWCARVAS